MGDPVASTEFLSSEGLAALLDVPLSTVYTWRYEGKGPPAYRIGKHLRFRRSDVEKWLEAQRADEKTGGRV